jgi:tetratricopeptide (TPR) repeat protein
LGQAQAAEQLKKDDEAAQSYDRLLTAKSSKVARQARLSLGALQFRRGQFASAVTTLKPLTELPADNPQREEARYWTALSLLQAGLHQPALDILMPWTDQAGPRAEEARYRAATALMALDRAVDAATLLNQIAGDGPWGEASLLARIQIAIAQQDDAAVDEMHQEFCRRYPQSPRTAEAAEIVARRLESTGKHAEAIELLRSRLGDGRKDDDADRRRRYLLAVSYVGTQRHDEALRQLDLVLQTGDRDLKRRALQSQGTILLSLARYQEAIAPLVASLEMHPGTADAAVCRGNLAVCYARTGRVAEAKQIDKELLSQPLDASLAVCALALAEASAAAGERDWAETLWRRIADSSVPTEHQTQALYSLARSQFLAGDAAESLTTSQKLVDRQPGGMLLARTQLLRAAALEKMGRKHEALQACRDLIAQETELSPAAMAKAGQLEQALGRPTEAIDFYRRLAKQYPQAPEADAALYQAAWLLQSAQRIEEAIDCFSKINQHYPGSPYWADATYRLAAAALKTGQYDAVRCLVTSLTESNQVPQEVLGHALLLDVQRGVAEGIWSDVETSASEIVKRAPHSKLAPVAEFWLAEAAYRLQRTDEAVQRFSALDDRKLPGQEAWLAMVPLRLGQLAAAARDWPEARRRVEQLRRDWPQGDHVQELEYLGGRCLAAEARFDEARQAFSRVTEADGQTKTETAAMAQWMIGETYLHQERHEEALRAYLRVEALFAYPRWQAAALLEAGRCYEALGRSAEATAAYQQILEKYSQSTYCNEARKRLQSAAAAPVSNPQPPSASREAVVPSHLPGRNAQR